MVTRTARIAGVPADPPVVVVEGDDPADVSWAFPWAVGDKVDVVPLSSPATRCGRCWACRGRGLVDAVRWRVAGGIVRRSVERITVWGGGVVVCFLVGSSGVHPAGAALAGLAFALAVAGLLSAGGPT